MRNNIGKEKFKYVILIALYFLILVNLTTVMASTYSLRTWYGGNDHGDCGKIIDGKLVSCEIRRNDILIYCFPGDTRTRCRDIGTGNSHGCFEVGTNACSAQEWGNNQGTNACEITCELPPTCQQYSPGCYNQRDEFAPFGTLANCDGTRCIEDFKVYYPQTVCREGNPENCRCSVQATTAIGQKDPDDSSSACSCIANSFWDPTKKCCDKQSDNYCVGNRGCFSGLDQGDCGVDNCLGPTVFNDFGQVTVIDNNGCISSGLDIGKCVIDKSYTNFCSNSTLTTHRCNGLDAEIRTIDCNIYDSTNPERPHIETQPKCDGQCGNGGVCSARDYGCSSDHCLFTPVDLDIGESWCNVCNGTAWAIRGNESEGCCGDDANEFITEGKGDLIDTTRSCCPSSSHCNFNSQCFSSGQWSNTTNNFFCDTGQWKEGDTSEETCTASVSGYTWTGSRCCGDDIGEYYNEPNKSIACWNGIPVFARNYVTSNSNPIHKEVINLNGSFEGCDTDTNNTLGSLTDSVTGLQLIHSNPFCTVVLDSFQQGQHAYCSPIRLWNQSPEIRDSLKSIAWAQGNENNTQQSGCCTSTQCWDGGGCINDQSDSASSGATNGYRCIQGNWSESPLKFNWDDSASGYCPQKSQCLVNPGSLNSKNGLVENFSLDFSSALNNNIQCINDTQYIGDNYCEAGNWSSRTKLLALALLENSKTSNPQNYTVYCDIFSNVLNNFEYSLPSGFNVKTDLITSCTIDGSQQPCTNNFCIVKKVSAVIIGSTLNKPIDNLPSILEAFELPANFCNNALSNDGQFHMCGSPLVWYNNKLRIFMFSKTPITINQINFSLSFVQLLKNPFSQIFNNIISSKPSISGLEVDLSELMLTKKFSTLFIYKSEGKSVNGVLEIVKGNPYLGIQYNNLAVDVCSTAGEINSERSMSASNVLFCNQSGSTTLVSSRYQIGKDAWQDLTSKLRFA